MSEYGSEVLFVPSRECVPECFFGVWVGSFIMWVVAPPHVRSTPRSRMACASLGAGKLARSNSFVESSLMVLWQHLFCRHS